MGILSMHSIVAGTDHPGGYMIDRLKKFFVRDNTAGPSEKRIAQDKDIHVATCALLLEMATIDGEFSDVERDRIMTILKNQYSLSDEDALALMDAAREEITKSIDLWQFTNLINRNYTEEEKIRVIETIWKVVYADGILEKHEDYLVHQLGKLLRLTHSQLIEAKLKVKESA